MIVTEIITKNNNKQYKYIYSDAGFELERDGVRYGSVIDPIDTDRVYIETDTLVETIEE